MLEITLMKSEPNVSWDSLLKNSLISSSDEPLQAIRDLTQPLASSLRTEMEECDFGDNEVEREYSLGESDGSLPTYLPGDCMLSFVIPQFASMPLHTRRHTKLISAKIIQSCLHFRCVLVSRSHSLCAATSMSASGCRRFANRSIRREVPSPSCNSITTER